MVAWGVKSGGGSTARQTGPCLARSSLRDYDAFLFAAESTEPARAVAAPGADEGAGVADEGAASGHMHPPRAATAVSPRGHAAENTGSAGDDMPPARDAAGATKRPHAEVSPMGSEGTTPQKKTRRSKQKGRRARQRDARQRAEEEAGTGGDQAGLHPPG